MSAETLATVALTADEVALVRRGLEHLQDGVNYLANRDLADLQNILDKLDAVS